MDINSYIVHRIPKSDGTLRVIYEPCPELKLRQKGVLRWLLARGICSGKYAHGFVRGRSTATNAAVHNIKMPIANGGEFNEQEFLKIKGMLAYFADARPDLAPRYRADIAEIERLLEMRENKLAA